LLSTSSPHGIFESTFQRWSWWMVWSVEICWMTCSFWNSFDLCWLPVFPYEWISIFNERTSEDKAQDVLSVWWGASTFWSGYSILESALWVCWPSTLAADISGPKFTLCLFMKSYERDGLQIHSIEKSGTLVLHYECCCLLMGSPRNEEPG
jgi:hypothetical protein